MVKTALQVKMKEPLIDNGLSLVDGKLFGVTVSGKVICFASK